jgi:hypothetical protein
VPGTAPADQGSVTVTAQQVVGPYATVQLHPDSTTDTMAVTSWLQANGYNIPTSVDPIIAAYVSEGFDFLAIKLVPGAGVQAMRPISVTSKGGALSLPLRMVAAGTGATVGITLWVVSAGRYEPQNFASFTIDPSTLVWDWSTSTSNYTTLRSQKESEFGNAAWQIESSLNLSPYAIESAVLQDPKASAYDAVPAADGGPGQTALEVRSQDLNTLFPQGETSVRITRMRADLSQAALAADLLLQASSDQATLSNSYQAKLSINANCRACNCQSGSGGGGGSGAFGTGSGGGPPSAGSSVSPGQHAGCSAASSEPMQVGLFAGIVGFASLALARARRRKRCSGCG